MYMYIIPGLARKGWVWGGSSHRHTNVNRYRHIDMVHGQCGISNYVIASLALVQIRLVCTRVHACRCFADEVTRICERAQCCIFLQIDARRIMQWLMYVCFGGVQHAIKGRREVRGARIELLRGRGRALAVETYCP